MALSGASSGPLPEQAVDTRPYAGPGQPNVLYRHSADRKESDLKRISRASMAICIRMPSLGTKPLVGQAAVA